MKSVHCFPKEPLQIVEKPIPELSRNGVLVKVSYAGICHSDLHLWEGYFDTGDPNRPIKAEDLCPIPMTLGHEISGVVTQINDDRDEVQIDIAVGDNVLLFTVIGCGDCVNCKGGRENICMGQRRMLGAQLPGGFAEYVMVPHYRYCIKCPTEIPMSAAALLSCSGLTAYNALSIAVPYAQEAAAMKGSSSLLIVGTGGLGTWAIKMAKMVMPPNTKVVAADISEDKLEAAKEAGADEGILWQNVPSPEVAAQTMTTCGGHVDVIIDFVNTTKTHGQTPMILRPGGLIVPVGMFGGASLLPLPLVALNQLNIKGAMMGNLTQLKELVKLLTDHKVTSPSIDFVTLEQAQECLEKLQSRKIKGRAVIKF